MADDANRSDKRVTDTEEEAVNASRRSLKYRGVCLWCEIPLVTGRIFCSTGCCKKYEQEQRRRKDLDFT